jgi:hypothetical protein
MQLHIVDDAVDGRRMAEEHQGRGKAGGRISDVYDDIELPYPDAKVAEKLCIEWSSLQSLSK